MNRLAANWMLFMASAKKGRLPSAYKEVEYLESTGTQYLNLNFTMDSDKSYTLDFIMTEYGRLAFGSRYGTTNRTFVFNTGSEGVYTASYGNERKNIGAVDNLRHTVSVIDRVLTFDGTIINTFSATIFTAYTCYLFAATQQTSLQTPAALKVFSCKIWDSGTLIRDLVPCYRKSDNKPGMYDLVNKVFYTNSGTGEFLLPGGNL